MMTQAPATRVSDAYRNRLEGVTLLNLFAVKSGQSLPSAGQETNVLTCNSISGFG